MAGNMQDSNSNSQSISNINITPFVDVTLVLLIIFMVTAPMLVKDILEVKLPKTQSSDGSVSQTLGIAINRDGNILINGTLADEETLTKTAIEVMQKAPDTQAIISADEEVIYKHVVKVIDILKTNGLNKFAVQIEKKL